MLASILLALLLTPNVAPQPEAQTFRLDRRVPLTTSKVAGWPDPPPPYRTRRVFDRWNFKHALHLHSNPAHDLVFIVEQAGQIVSLPVSGDKAPTEMLKIADADIYAMTFHPEYAKNRFVYVFSNGPNSKPEKFNRILRYKTSGEPPKCDPATMQVVIEWKSNGHNGGDLAFGKDGMLYITSGDGTSDSDLDNTGQDLSDLCSGMIRIDVDRPDKGRNYSIPKDNPFLAVPKARGELWAFGFRNPWRMTFDSVTGDLLVGDVGQDMWEMIRLVTKGSNHGWSVTEGSQPFHTLRTKGPGEIVPPLIEHAHWESRSITGGVVYHGKKFPELDGVYIYGDYSTGKIWGLKWKGNKVTWKQDLALTRLRIVGIGTDNAGEIYFVDYDGLIHQLEKSPTVKEASSFPRTLSQSGLYLSVKDHKLHPALIPYGVNAQLWSDGTHKERAMAIPGTELLQWRDRDAWKFPENTTLVKTFSLDLADGSRKRIETRFMTLQQGEWYGYSYAWRYDQSDADLVEAAGRNRVYPIHERKSATGKAELDWRYPSRLECMVCHTRASGYVLGLSTHQMNREFDYPHERRNQLLALDALEVFRFPKRDHARAIDSQAKQLGHLMSAFARPVIKAGPLSGLADCWLVPAYEKAAKRLDGVREKYRKIGDRVGGETPRLPKPPSEYGKLVDPMNTKEPIEKRVRSYLHANCAHCHVWAGGGNSAIDLHIETPREKMKLINENPLHDRFGIENAKLVAPGSPERSVLLQRISRRGKGQMPPLATHQVDEQAVTMIREWIAGLKE
jgi:glucose/arabinose dehydrogenase